MGVFKDEVDTKRVIFNVRVDLADRLEKAKARSRSLGKKLDVDTAVDKAIEKFLKKAEKKLAEMTRDMPDADFPVDDLEDDADSGIEIRDEDVSSASGSSGSKIRKKTR